MRLPSRGFDYELNPPLPVDVLEGTVKGTLQKPIAGYVPKPGVKYASSKIPTASTSPEAAPAETRRDPRRSVLDGDVAIALSPSLVCRPAAAHRVGERAGRPPAARAAPTPAAPAPSAALRRGARAAGDGQHRRPAGDAEARRRRQSQGARLLGGAKIWASRRWKFAAPAARGRSPCSSWRPGFCRCTRAPSPTTTRRFRYASMTRRPPAASSVIRSETSLHTCPLAFLFQLPRVSPTMPKLSRPRPVTHKRRSIEWESRCRSRPDSQMAEENDGKFSRKDVKGVLESLATIGYKELKKNGTFLHPGLRKVRGHQEPATKERKGINPFTKEPTIFKAKPARKNRPRPSGQGRQRRGLVPARPPRVEVSTSSARATSSREGEEPCEGQVCNRRVQLRDQLRGDRLRSMRWSARQVFSDVGVVLARTVRRGCAEFLAVGKHWRVSSLKWRR